MNDISSRQERRPFSIFSTFLMIVSGMILAVLMFAISITSAPN